MEPVECALTPPKIDVVVSYFEADVLELPTSGAAFRLHETPVPLVMVETLVPLVMVETPVLVVMAVAVEVEVEVVMLAVFLPP
jgi:hypothetical protein